MPESQTGWAWIRHRIKVDREDVDWDEHPKGWQAGLGSHDSGSNSKGQYRDDPEQTKPIWIDCLGCEKCLHTHPNWPQLFVLKEGSFRHTRAHEFIFQLSKKMGYWSNQAAAREATGNNTHSRGIKRDPPIDHAGQGHKDWVSYMDRDDEIARSGRNPRSVMDVPTAPYKGAHYATFPPNLIAPLIRATCPRWACPVCGQGWSPVVENPKIPDSLRNRSSDTKMSFKPTQLGGGQVIQDWRENNPPQIKEYRPTCEHEHIKDEAVPGIVCDPFLGSGTVAFVAKQLQRRWFGLDISFEYLDEQARYRAKWGEQKTKIEDLPLFELL